MLTDVVGRVGEERPLGVARVLEAVVPAVRRLQEQGKVRHIGLSEVGVDQLEQAEAEKAAALAAEAAREKAARDAEPLPKIRTLRGGIPGQVTVN